jgi:kumamolisin
MADGYGLVPLAGSFRTSPLARWLGPAPPLSHVTAAVVLPGPDDELGSLVQTLQKERAKRRKHLTNTQFAHEFSASSDHVDAVRLFAHNNRLNVINADPARRVVELGGSVRAMSRAFGVELHLFRSEENVFRGRTGPVLVPQWLAPHVQAVLGLDTRPVSRPHIRRGRVIDAGVEPAAAAQAFNPPDLAQLYNFPPNTDGTGQCIAIIELGGGFRQSELDQYFNHVGVPSPKVEAISVAGGQNTPTGNPDGPDGEVMLDIEVVGSLAPGADIAVYFAPNTDRGFAAAILAAAHDTERKPSIISISWGAAEETWTAQSRRAMSQAFLACAALGITVLAAAGDNGSSDGLPGRKAHVDFPAASPFVVGCGGTTLLEAGGAIASETVWNDAGGGATGGGVSRVFRVPPFQSSINPVSSNPGRQQGRGVPDVSGVASPRTGYQVLVDGRSLVIGGTSAVAPLWSALFARVQQKIGARVAPALGTLYQHPDAFRDITNGSNGAYTARAGWDACTGLGSPDGVALAQAFA